MAMPRIAAPARESGGTRCPSVDPSSTSSAGPSPSSATFADDTSGRVDDARVAAISERAGRVWCRRIAPRPFPTRWPAMDDPRAVYERLDEFQILDVREPYEWEAGHIEGAIHAPLAEVMEGRDPGRISTERPV